MKRAEQAKTPQQSEMPDITPHIRFAPDTGHIHLFDQRMLLMHGFSLGEMRRELIARMGVDEARKMFMRLGYQQGIEDQIRLRELTQSDIQQCLALGPRLREIEGFVRNLPLQQMQYSPDKSFYADYVWSASWEAEAQLEHIGPSGEAACWMMVGYANGFCTSLLGKPIVWREVECVAMGHAHCRVIGKPLEEWDNPEEDVHFLRIEDFVDGPAPASASQTLGKKYGRASQAVELGELIGASAGFNAVVQLLKKVAPTDATVLFLGESGVGKERFSRTLHAIGPRAEHPFVSVNCAAIPAELVEAELFGVEKGAYTHATASRPGKFERANGGTLFLDEIGCLPYAAQGKLLRVLQEQEIERVGDTRSRRIDVRVVAATNQDLRRDVQEGRFRRDLYYRLNVFPVEIPPLRERRDDIPLLLNLFLDRYSRKFAKKIVGLSEKAFDAIWAYDWPGNVRELENMVERAIILADEGGRLDMAQLFTGGEQLGSQGFSVSPVGGLVSVDQRSIEEAGALDQVLDMLLDAEVGMDQIEQHVLARALVRSRGNVSATARSLKLGRGQLQYRLAKFQQQTKKSEE